MAKYVKTEEGYKEIEEVNSNKMDANNPVGTGSFSMGRKVGSVIGNSSHAEGRNTTASGDYSHAEGYDTTASGEDSHAEGYRTKARGTYQHVQGKFNIEDTNNKYSHIVGNGTNSSSRSNAHTLDWDGNAWFAGTVKVGGAGQNDIAAKTLATTEDIPTVDGTLTQPGQAADAKAVGDRLSTLSEDIVTASESKVSAHNTGTDTHSDIRLLIQDLTGRLNALADSDDTTLDQLSEIVAYIKSNRDLIDAVTTSKVSVTDIANDLATNVSNKPLSAAQGVVIKTLIDALRNDKLDAAELTNAINTALAQAKESGEFAGADGHTPEYGVDYGTPEQIAGIAHSAADILQPDVDQIKADLIKKIDKPSTTDNGKTPRAKNGNVEWVELGDWYVTPEMYGALGDGRNDDTPAFQHAAETGKPIVLNTAKRYTLLGSIDISDLTEVTLIAYKPAGYDFNSANILCYDSFFKSTTEHTTRMAMHGIHAYFYGAEYGAISDCWVCDNMSLSQSVFDNCVFANFAGFVRGALHDLCNIVRSNFVAITRAFILSGDAEPDSDSVISECYISGTARQNPVCFDCINFTRMRVNNCYIDFFKTVLGSIEKYMSATGTIFSDNIFDYIWRFNGASFGNGAYMPVIISNNTFLRINKSDLAQVFLAPDTDMVTDGEISNYGAFASVQRYRNEIDGFSIVNNQCVSTDIFINVYAYKMLRLRVVGNAIPTNCRVRLEVYDPAKGCDISIDTYNMQVLESPPQDVLNKTYICYFPGMRCLYGGRLYALDESGVWVSVLG